MMKVLFSLGKHSLPLLTIVQDSAELFAWSNDPFHLSQWMMPTVCPSRQKSRNPRSRLFAVPAADGQLGYELTGISPPVYRKPLGVLDISKSCLRESRKA